MPILLAGSDARYAALGEMLRESGFETQMLTAPEDAKHAEALISKYPFDERAEKSLDFLAPGARLNLLPAREIDPSLKERFRVQSLMDDGLFVYENAVLTAEGALSVAMKETPFALGGTRVMVVGYGRIGRALTEMLIALGARVTVMSRRETGRLGALSRGARAVDEKGMAAELTDSRVIFVTSPDRVLGAEALTCVSRRAFLYDLSSAPYGVDLAAAREMGLRVSLESALPGRYCPESAARVMYRALLRIWNGGKSV